ncbi:MAG: DUF3576 domain-containing protein [Parvularculaceae bacterium]|nr:DUF3576 domain-containing protein [Parvularculaceae bacterium]
MKTEKSSLINVLLTAAAAAALAACGTSGGKGRDIPLASVVLGKNEQAQASTVNRFLWAASLETLDFLPMKGADPIAGLIMTDWYQNPETPDEQFKVDVYILDSALRADGLRVSVFRQERTPEGGWRDAGVNPATAREIENAILTRARQLRLNQLND